MTEDDLARMCREAWAGIDYRAMWPVFGLSHTVGVLERSSKWCERWIEVAETLEEREHTMRVTEAMDAVGNISLAIEADALESLS
jgi:hypothetical protein